MSLPAGCLGGIARQGIGETHPFRRLLVDAVELLRLLDADDLEDRGCSIVDMVELRALLRWEATCLNIWNGVSMAQAQPTA